MPSQSASNSWRTTSRLAASASSGRLTGRECGASFSSCGSSAASARDRQHRLAELVERLHRLGLGRLDHQRLGHDQREVDGRRVEVVVHQPLGDVQRRHAVLALQVARREHELVHAVAVVGQLVGVAQPRQQVVGVEHRRLRHLPEPRPPHADERVRPHEHAERPAEAAHAADRLRPVVVEPVVVALADDDRRRQVRLDDVAHGNGAGARPAAAVRLRERLVQVEVQDVEPHVARAGDAAARRSGSHRRSRAARRRRGRCRRSR